MPVRVRVPAHRLHVHRRRGLVDRLVRVLLHAGDGRERGALRAVAAAAAAAPPHAPADHEDDEHEAADEDVRPVLEHLALAVLLLLRRALGGVRLL